MKRFLLMLITLSGSLLCAQSITLDLPSAPELMEGETLADVDTQVNEAIKNFKDAYGRDPKMGLIMASFEAHYREFARLFKLYIANPTPAILQAYYNANTLIQEDIEKLKRANPIAAKDFTVPTLSKSLKLN